MGYIGPGDIIDQDLSRLSFEIDFDNADDYLIDLGLENGVVEADLQVDPLPFKVKRMMIFWVMVEICIRNIGKNITTNASGYDTDWYEKKLQQYEKRLKEYVSMCTAKVLKGEADEYDDISEGVNAIERA